MNKSELGQVFTPADICSFMVSLLPNDSGALILEPCFGKGAFLSALQAAGFTNVIGYEIDKELYAQTVKQFNYGLHRKDFLSVTGEGSFDAVIMNPPYIRHESFSDLRKYGIEMKKARESDLFKELPARSNLYVYFLVKAFSLIKKGGVIDAIIPSAWTSKGSYITSYITRHGGVIKRIPLDGLPFGPKALTSADIVLITKVDCDHPPKGSICCQEPNESVSMHKQLSSSCVVRRGLTTGDNSFFVNNEDLSAFSVPLLSDTRKLGLFSVGQTFDDFVAMIPAEESHKRIDSIVRKAADLQKTKKPVTLYQKLVNGQIWYSLEPVSAKKGTLVFSYIIRKKMRFVYCKEPMLVKDNFYLIYSDSPRLMLPLLNNYYVFDQLEKAGKNYGGGMLKVQAYDVKNLLIVDPSIIDEHDKVELISLGSKMIRCGSESSATHLIEQATSFLSKYETTSFNDIKSKYLRNKKRRLEMKNEE